MNEWTKYQEHISNYYKLLNSNKNTLENTKEFPIKSMFFPSIWMYFIKTEFYFLLQNTKKIIFNKNTKKCIFYYRNSKNWSKSRL